MSSLGPASPSFLWAAMGLKTLALILNLFCISSLLPPKTVEVAGGAANAEASLKSFLKLLNWPALSSHLGNRVIFVPNYWSRHSILVPLPSFPPLKHSLNILFEILAGKLSTVYGIGVRGDWVACPPESALTASFPCASLVNEPPNLISSFAERASVASCVMQERIYFLFKTLTLLE